MFDAMRAVSSELAKRLGVRPASSLRLSSAGALPVPQPLTRLFGAAGLRRGSTVSIDFSLALVASVMAGFTRAGLWCAVVGVPELSAAAARRTGVDLSRCVFVAPGAWLGDAVATLIDGVDLVVIGEPRRLAAVQVRPLVTRARQAGAALLGAGGWPGADVRLEVMASSWSGAEKGYGQLTSRRVRLRAVGRRVPLPRQLDMTIGVDGYE